MPLKRKRGSIKRTVKRRKFGGRSVRKAVGRSRVHPSVTVHHYTRWCANGAADSGEGAQTISLLAGTNAIAFVPHIIFSNLINYTEFTALYDNYKIKRVHFVFQLITNPDALQFENTSSSNYSTIYPKLWYVKDQDDRVTPTLDVMRQYADCRCRVLMPNKIVRISMRPNILVQAYNTALTTQYFPAYNKWLDANNVSTEHYGMKFLVETMQVNAAANSPYHVRVEVKYDFACKTPR